MAQFNSNPRGEIAVGTLFEFMTNAVLRTASRSVTEVIAANRGGVDVIIGNLQPFQELSHLAGNADRFGCGVRVTYLS